MRLLLLACLVGLIFSCFVAYTNRYCVEKFIGYSTRCEAIKAHDESLMVDALDVLERCADNIAELDLLLDDCRSQLLEKQANDSKNHI